MASLQILHFSDVLCVWAYVSQIRIDELCRVFGADIELDYHFVDVFGDVPGRLRERWQDRGGLPGYAEHVAGVVGQFEHVEVHPEVWMHHVPSSSLSCHHFLRAVHLAFGKTALNNTARALREAFFLRAEDVSRRSVQLGIVEEQHLARREVEAHLDSGLAAAMLSRDARMAQEMGITVSPTLVLGEGRQILKGNVGYKVIEANVQELLGRSGAQQHSWC